MPCRFPSSPPPSWLLRRYYVYGVLGDLHRVAFIKPLRGTMIATFRSFVGAPAPTPLLYPVTIKYQSLRHCTPWRWSLSVVMVSAFGRVSACRSLARLRSLPAVWGWLQLSPSPHGTDCRRTPFASTHGSYAPPRYSVTCLRSFVGAPAPTPPLLMRNNPPTP